MELISVIFERHWQNLLYNETLSETDTKMKKKKIIRYTNTKIPRFTVLIHSYKIGVQKF